MARRRKVEGFHGKVGDVNGALLFCTPTPEFIREDVGRLSHTVVVEMIPAAEGSSLRAASSPDSSRSACSLEQKVCSEAQRAVLVAKVQALQHEAVTLREEIRGGKVGLTHVQATLEKMLQEHSHLATTVSRIMACLELVNQESNGRAAKHIATSHTSLGEQLSLLAKHISALEEALRDESGHLHISPLNSPTLHSASSTSINTGNDRGSPTSMKTDNDRGSPTSMKNNNDRGSPTSIQTDNDRGSPCLPDIYLTPSLPLQSTTSHQYSVTNSSPGSPHPRALLSPPGSCSPPKSYNPRASLSPPGTRSPPSSLSQMDPFTPDDSRTPPTRDHSEEPETYSGVPVSTEHKQGDGKRDFSNTITSVCDGALGPACVSTVNTCTHNDPVVLQWLRNTQDYHSSSEEEEEEEEEEGREEEGEEKESTPDSRGPSSSGWGVDDCDSVHTMARGDRSPTVSSGVQPSDSPVSPPVSSPCADSGISCSTGHHCHPQLIPTITMSEIEALRGELARLREEITNPSNWSLSLDAGGPPAKTGVPGHISRASISHTTTVSVPNHTPTNFTQTVSRPYHFVSRPYCYSATPATPCSTTAFTSQRRLFSSNSRPLFSTPRDSIHRDQQSNTHSERPQVVSRSVQTTPTTSDTCFGIRTRNIGNETGSNFMTTEQHSRWTPSHITSRPHSSPLPTFTPRLIIRTTSHQFTRGYDSKTTADRLSYQHTTCGRSQYHSKPHPF